MKNIVKFLYRYIIYRTGCSEFIICICTLYVLLLITFLSFDWMFWKVPWSTIFAKLYLLLSTNATLGSSLKKTKQILIVCVNHTGNNQQSFRLYLIKTTDRLLTRVLDRL